MGGDCVCVTGGGGVRVHVDTTIGHARTKYVGKYQACRVENGRLFQHES